MGGVVPFGGCGVRKGHGDTAGMEMSTPRSGC